MGQHRRDTVGVSSRRRELADEVGRPVSLECFHRGVTFRVVAVQERLYFVRLTASRLREVVSLLDHPTARLYRALTSSFWLFHAEPSSRELRFESHIGRRYDAARA